MKIRNVVMGIVLLAVVMLVAWVHPVAALAEEEAKFCVGCQKDIPLSEYIPIGGPQVETLTLEAGKHYCLESNITGVPDNGVLISGAGCVELNGYNITAGDNCIAISCGGGTTNIMGEGVVTGTYTTTSFGATIHTKEAATVHLYGGTYKKTGNNAAVYVGNKCKVHLYDGATIDTAGTFATYPTAVFMEKASGLFHMHGGMIIGGTTTGNGGSVRVSNGSFTMDGGTVTGGVADRGGNIAVNSSGKLTVSGGTITSGTANATYGGGNIYTNKRAVTISGGLITQGTAAGSSYGGGNIGVYRATLNITGGTISGGVANAAECTGGGNLYVEGDISKLNITGGTVIDGTTVGSGGNIYAVGGEITITDGTISGGIATSNGGNILLAGSTIISGGTIENGQAARGGNIAVRDGGDLTMNGGTISGGTARETYGGGNIYTNKCPVTIHDGLITKGVATGSSYGGGNIGIYKATVNMTGGTVSEGRAANEKCRGGGNVYMEGDNAVFNMTGGLVTAGYIATGRGHSFYTRSGSMTFGAAATIKNKAEGTGGSMNLYLHDGSLESAASFAGGVYVMDGKVSLTGGVYYSFYYYGAESCNITGGVFRLDYSQYVPLDYCWIRRATSGDYIYKVVHKDAMPGTVLVCSDGTECYTDEPLTQFDAETYTHMKLYRDMDLGDLTQKEIWVDLNGNDLTLSGSGKVYAFDTSNDSYDATACGVLTADETVEVVQDVCAPNGRRYIALFDGTVTMHRLYMAVTTLTLKSNAAGLSYKTTFYCDEALAAQVRNYGMVLSVHNMPGADFLTETGDINRYSVSAKPFVSGTVTQSVAVVDIMRKTASATTNARNGETPIYATGYVELDGGLILVSDRTNAGKTKEDTDFTGVAYSLQDAMNMLDSSFAQYGEADCKRIDNFYFTWKDRGMDWSFKNIGKSVAGDLVLDENRGYCPVCRKTVEWIAIDQLTYAETPYGTAADGAHVFLKEDITYTGAEGNAFILAPATAGHTACIHLNGHALTATKSRAVYGGQSIINVMGSGTVSGYIDSSKYGAAVQISTSSTTGVVNLYSGTYKHSAGSHTGSYVAAIRNYGGTINVYKDAYIDGSYNGKALMTGTSAQSNSVINLYDTQVEGDIYLTGSTGFETKLVVEDTAVNGTLDANGVNTVILRGSAAVKTLDIAQATMITLDGFTGSKVMNVIATGCFTTPCDGIEAYTAFFVPAKEGYKTEVFDHALYCVADYSAPLELDSNNTGYCPACKKNVQWIALTEAGTQSHVYLAETADAVVFERDVCLHLNGSSIPSVGSSAGMLNVMGSGTVAGVAVQGGTANLYSGTYSNTVTCSSGTLNMYEDVNFTPGCAVNITGGALYLKGTRVQGDVVLEGQTATIDSAAIDGELRIGTDVQVTLTGKPIIKNMVVTDGVCVQLKDLLNGTNVAVSANGVFTAPYENVRDWADYFRAYDDANWIVVQKDVLNCMQYKTPPAGKKILVVGNSMTYYGKYVIDKGHVLPLTTRTNDRGYLYQVFYANGYDVSVTNFTFGGHTLKDFYSGKCAADRGHNGHNHLEDLTDRNYDYVIFQEGSEAASNTDILAECQPLMELFRAENPDTKFVFMVQSTVHRENNAWRTSIKDLEDNGIIVVDWGAITEDLINGVTTAPGATQTFGKFTFTVNKSAKDGRHPNILAGYLAAQMTCCAITGESAVGMNYSFWDDTKANSAFKLSSYLKTYYSYDQTEPSNTNFQTVFESEADMLALQQLIDRYLEEKSYRNY